MVAEVKKERPWWLRLDGAPPGWAERLWPSAPVRPLTKGRVLFLRLWFLGVALALVVAVIFRVWFLVGPLSVQFLQLLIWPKENRNRFSVRLRDPGDARKHVVWALVHGVRPPT